MIAPQLSSFEMNEAQRTIISHTQGPLLVIAGPGSGKTQSLTLLALNLLLCKHAKPNELVLCTYTEKVAFEMRDRISQIAREVQYKEDLSQLHIGTIHEVCNQFIADNIHHSPIGNNYETLDQFTQQLFIFEHIDDICKGPSRSYFEKQFKSLWNAAQKLQVFFDKIVDELIFDKLREALPSFHPLTFERNAFLYYLTHAYSNYKRLLIKTNHIDFAHQQKWAYDLLRDPETFLCVTKNIRYVLVDEYQDTNYIQEQIITKLASATGTNNLCVVGDEDQALYRFRGATVRNILEFQHKFDCEPVYLTTNYRSHPAIINTYNQWIQSTDWRNLEAGGPAFRTEKTILPDSGKANGKYPAVFSIADVDVHEEAEQLAELITLLKVQGNISDYNEVAILLNSVQSYLSGPYITALAKRGIHVFCPRAKMYFEQQEICLIVGCFALLLGYGIEKPIYAIEREEFSEYIYECLQKLAQQREISPALNKELHALTDEIASLDEQQDTQKGLADYFYRLVFTPPFIAYLAEKRQMQNLVIFSQLLQTFQNYYHHTSLTAEALEQIRHDFFQTFLSLLHKEGLNEYEDQREPFPKNHVQILTIHQAKGLEFPVVIVGRLEKGPRLFRPSTYEEEVNHEAYLQKFSHRSSFEPERRISEFDFKRKYYVAFSRAEHLLVLTAHKKPYKLFEGIWNDIPAWPYIRDDLRTMPQQLEPKMHVRLKRRFSFVGHINMYETCPRRFQFFREYDFKPAHTIDAFFGQLVHQTIERIHRHILDMTNKQNLHLWLTEQHICELFEKTCGFLQHTQIYPISDAKKEKAYHQVRNYVFHNWEEMRAVQETEYNVSVEKDNYILTGTIDLLRTYQGGLEILDFKTMSRPDDNSRYLQFYQKQLYVYAHALEKRTGTLPNRLLLYWTAEESKEKALMVIPFQREAIIEVGRYFDEIVTKIQRGQFTVTTPPGPNVCNICDIRHLCATEGIIQIR